MRAKLSSHTTKTCLLASILAVAVVACDQAVPVKGPDGQPGWYTIECHRSQAVCYSLAGEQCPNGYLIADSSGHSGTYVNANAYGATTIPANSQPHGATLRRVMGPGKRTERPGRSVPRIGKLIHGPKSDLRTPPPGRFSQGHGASWPRRGRGRRGVAEGRHLTDVAAREPVDGGAASSRASRAAGRHR